MKEKRVGGRERKERKRNGRSERGKKEKEKENNTERKENVMINGFLFYLSLGKPFQI